MLRNSGVVTAFFCSGATGRSMKFVIEVILASETDTEILDRIEIDAMSKKRAVAKAKLLLSHWRNKGATGTRVATHRTEEAAKGAKLVKATEVLNSIGSTIDESSCSGSFPGGYWPHSIGWPGTVALGRAGPARHPANGHTGRAYIYLRRGAGAY